MATDNPEQPLSAESELAGAARPRWLVVGC
jgi:hypothetical protein